MLRNLVNFQSVLRKMVQEMLTNLVNFQSVLRKLTQEDANKSS